MEYPLSIGPSTVVFFPTGAPDHLRWHPWKSTTAACYHGTPAITEHLRFETLERLKRCVESVEYAG